MDQPVEVDRTGDLGIENAPHRALRFALDRLIVHHAGGVDDAGDWPELGPNLLQRPLDAGVVGDIACEDADLCAERPDRANSTHALRAHAVSRKDAQDIVPLGLRWQVTAREQREFDFLEPRKMLCHLQGDTAEAASDDIDAAITQPGPSVLRGRDAQFVLRFDPARCSSQRDQAIGGRPEQLVEQGSLDLPRTVS